MGLLSPGGLPLLLSSPLCVPHEHLYSICEPERGGSGKFLGLEGTSGQVRDLRSGKWEEEGQEPLILNMHEKGLQDVREEHAYGSWRAGEPGRFPGGGAS